MRKLIIILAVFVLLFVAVLIWGVARDREGPVVEDGQPVPCKGPPKKKQLDPETGKIEETINLDRMDEWKENCVSKKGSNLADNLAKGVVLDPETIRVEGGQQISWSVPPGDDEEAPQQVKLTLLSGSLVRIFAPKPNDDAKKDQKLCLCAGDVLIEDLNRECTNDWIGDNIGKRQAKRADCNDSAKSTKVFFGPGGGDIEVEAIGQRAEIGSAK